MDAASGCEVKGPKLCCSDYIGQRSNPLFIAAFVPGFPAYDKNLYFSTNAWKEKP